jgi:hypothetical protein
MRYVGEDIEINRKMRAHPKTELAGFKKAILNSHYSMVFRAAKSVFTRGRLTTTYMHVRMMSLDGTHNGLT